MRGIGKEHPLTAVLVAKGFTVREAHRVINSIFSSIKDALRRHETADLPFGSLRVVANVVAPYRRWCHGRPVEFYNKRFRIDFIPKETDES